VYVRMHLEFAQRDFQIVHIDKSRATHVVRAIEERNTCMEKRLLSVRPNLESKKVNNNNNKVHVYV